MDDRPVVNVYTLRVSELEEGVSLVPPRTGFIPQLYLGSDSRAHQLHVPLGTESGGSLPKIKDMKVLGAAPGTYNGLKCLVEQGSWDGIILRIIAKDLHFGIPSHARMTFWAGGEGAHHLVRLGGMDEPERRDEIFALEEGQRIVIADRRQAIKVLTCKDGRPSMRVSGCEEVIAYILECGMADGATSSKMSWSFNTLVALGAESEARKVNRRMGRIGMVSGGTHRRLSVHNTRREHG